MTRRVIGAARQSTGALRHVLLTLAMLAVALKVMVPAGFMVGAPGDGSVFPLVLCTSQGAVTIDAGDLSGAHHDGGQAPAKSAHDSPCAFSGHAAAAEPPSALDAEAAQFVAYEAAQIRSVAWLAPGRGLAAPPLPARGPPSLLT